MLIDVTVPAAGESITSANLARWHRQSGDTVRRGETLVTLETDKIATELEAPADGILQILIAEDREVPIGTLIAQIKTERGLQSAPQTKANHEPHSAPHPITERGLQSAPQTKANHEPQAAPHPITERGLQSAPQTKANHEPHPALQQPPRTTRRKLSMLRRKIATQLVNAQQTAAILTTFNEVDLSAVQDLRSQVQDAFQLKHGVKLGLMSFFIKATVTALQKVPALNARIDGDEVIENHFYDLAVAISTPTGLIAPVLRDCDQKSFADLERELAELATRARAGQLTIADLQGGVFTLSNGGVFGSLFSTPILNAPQSGLLGMHAIQQRPVARDGQVVIRPMMYLALSYDHRLVDGKDAVAFLSQLKSSLETPISLLLTAC
jgi:2-oxoglutarate dehydrogenase E2 component (dihydrolipoamide succinyltransferase)